MKRIIALLPAVVLIFVMSGCRSTSEIDSTSFSSNYTSAETSSEIDITQSVDVSATSSASMSSSETGIGHSENIPTYSSTSVASSNTGTAGSSGSATPTPTTPQNTLNTLYEYRTNYNFGSNKKLEGNITVHCFFVNENNTDSWTVMWANWYANTQVKHALNFLKTQAAKYGKTLNFTTEYYLDPSTPNGVSTVDFNKNYSMKYNGIIDNAAVGENYTLNVLEVIANNMGYNAAFILKSELEYESKTEHIFLIFSNKQGRSYSNDANADNENFTEHSIIFAYDLNRPPETGIPSEYNSLTIAHEILHSYGAEDFYISDKRNELALQYYPNDVMLSIDPPVSSKNIGELTAFQIGWTDTAPEICKNSNWWQ